MQVIGIGLGDQGQNDGAVARHPDSFVRERLKTKARAGFP